MGIVAFLGLLSLAGSWLFIFMLGETPVFTWVLLLLGIALIAVALVVDFRRVSTTLHGRRGKLGISTTVTISLFFAIVLLVNVISGRYYRRFDFTRLSEFTLTSQTQDVLDNLDKPVSVVAFFSPRIPSRLTTYAIYLLREYGHRSDKISIKEFDPELNPAEASLYGVDQFGVQYGAVIFQGPDGERWVFGPQIAARAEHGFTTAILEVTGAKQKTAYIVTDLWRDRTTNSFSSAIEGLRDSFFEVRELDLAAAEKVPADATIVIVAGPERTPRNGHIDALSAYLLNNGRLLMLLDPGPIDAYGQLLNTWGLEIGSGVVIDPASYVYPHHENLLVPADRNSFGLPDIYLSRAAPIISIEDNQNELAKSALLWTSRSSWVENDFSVVEKPEYDEEVDGAGPLAVGALVSRVSDGQDREGEGARIAVVGDSDFASNQSFHDGRNGEFFLSTINWLSAGKNIVTIEPKTLVARRLLLTAGEARFLHISSIALLPLIVLVSGTIVWWRRRNR